MRVHVASCCLLTIFLTGCGDGPDLPDKLSCAKTLPARIEDATMVFDFESPPTVTFKSRRGLISGNVGRAKKNGFAFEVVGVGPARMTVNPVTGAIEPIPSNVSGGWTITPLSKTGSNYQVKVEAWQSGESAELGCIGSNKYTVVKWIHKLPEP